MLSIYNSNNYETKGISSMKKVVIILSIILVLLSCSKNLKNINEIISKDDIPQDDVIGVRDFVWVMENNSIHLLSQKRVGYFNVFMKNSPGPIIYRAVEQDESYSVRPIIIKRDYGVDDLGISIGSVIYHNGSYQLFYSGLTEINNQLTYYTFNTAFSDDGIVFKNKKTLLTNNIFNDSTHIGLPYTIAIGDGENQSFIMMCESINGNTCRYCIYGAYGSQGVFRALNSGNPILEGSSIDWPFKAGVGGVANPKIKQGGKDLFFLGFNAVNLDYDDNAWRLGLGSFKLINGEVCDIKISKKPINVPIDAKRIESAEIIYNTKRKPMEIIFFCTPTYNATKGAKIYQAVFK